MAGDVPNNLGKVSIYDVCHLFQMTHKNSATTGIFLLYGSWNTKGSNPSMLMEKIYRAMNDNSVMVGHVQVDETEETVECCVGDNDAMHCLGPCPPSELPVLVAVGQKKSMIHSSSEFVQGVSSLELLQCCRDDTRILSETWIPQLLKALTLVKQNISAISTTNSASQSIRIFVAGDRSNVGKSSICLGILGSLVSMGYAPESLAYIKPATQSESPQLVQAYCDKVGISCVPVGPIVYYRGFTRAFLAGNAETTEELLAKGAAAVDKLAAGKRVILIDGVGFPSVGSICGTDNASMALACGYPTEHGSRTPATVLIVGGSGVGAAVDAFNLNSTYFKSRNIPVLGAVFNKLSMEGFYSLENCRQQVTAYFDQNQRGPRPFGFVPQFPEIAGKSPMDHVDEFIRIFGSHVDISGIVEAAARHLPSASKHDQGACDTAELRPVKRAKLKGPARHVLKREDIESKAMEAGAAPSA